MAEMLSSEAHLHATLHGLGSRLDRMESKIDDINVSAFDERLSSQLRMTERHEQNLANHSDRLREAEIQAVTVHTFTDSIKELKDKTESIQKLQINNQGAGAVIGDLFKWFAGVSAALIVYAITNSTGAVEALKNVVY